MKPELVCVRELSCAVELPVCGACGAVMGGHGLAWVGCDALVMSGHVHERRACESGGGEKEGPTLPLLLLPLPPCWRQVMPRLVHERLDRSM